MKLDLYTAISSALPFVALVISLISLLLSMRNRSDQRQALLLSKKTDLITKRANRYASLETLVLVYLQEKDILLKRIGSGANAGDDLQRVDAGLTNSLERKLACQKQLSNSRAMPATDLAVLEQELTSENEYSAYVSGELTREQETLKKLIGP